MGPDDTLIHLVTPYSSVDEFVDQFAGLTTATEIIVPALPHASVGTLGQFVICLKDQTEMMRGRCEVTELGALVVSSGASPATSGSGLMRLRMREMDAHTCGIHLRLMERHASRSQAPAVPEPTRKPLAPLCVEPAAPSSPSSTIDSLEVTVVPGEPPRSEAPRPEMRAPGTAPPPAAPLSDVDTAELATLVEPTLVEPTLVESTLVEPTVVDAGAPSGEGAVVRGPVPREGVRTRRARTRPLWRRVALLASCATVAMVAIVLEPSPRAVPVVKAPRAVESTAVAPPAAAPPAPAALAASEVESTTPPPRACVARVKTIPAGAEVQWGDIALGTSPIDDVAIPCGSAVVTLRLERYAEVSQVIVTDHGQAAVVAQRLKRMSAHDRAKSRRSARSNHGASSSRRST